MSIRDKRQRYPGTQIWTSLRLDMGLTAGHGGDMSPGGGLSALLLEGGPADDASDGLLLEGDMADDASDYLLLEGDMA